MIMFRREGGQEGNENRAWARSRCGEEALIKEGRRGPGLLWFGGVGRSGQGAFGKRTGRVFSVVSLGDWSFVIDF